MALSIAEIQIMREELGKLYPVQFIRLEGENKNTAIWELGNVEVKVTYTNPNDIVSLTIELPAHAPDYFIRPAFRTELESKLDAHALTRTDLVHIRKVDVLKALSRTGYWKGYIAPSKVAKHSVRQNWCLGAEIELILVDGVPHVKDDYENRSLEQYINSFKYHACSHELGFGVAFWGEILVR